MAKWGRRGWRSRRRIHIPRFVGGRKLWIIIPLIACLLLLQFFIFVEKNLRPPLMHVAAMRVKQVTTQAINKAISQQVNEAADVERLIDWKMNDNGRISGFMINYNESIRITSQTINTVENTIKDINRMPEHIPIGQAFNSAIISSFGPRVPVKFDLLGAVQVDLNTRQKDAAINMVLVEVYIRVKAEVAVIIPFDTQPEIVETEIPISYLLVVGDVPMYYYDNKGNPVGGGSNPPAIAVPPAAESGHNNGEKPLLELPAGAGTP